MTTEKILHRLSKIAEFTIDQEDMCKTDEARQKLQLIEAEIVFLMSSISFDARSENPEVVQYGDGCVAFKEFNGDLYIN